eukprot:1738752-Rhodomonas_salina.1
MRLDVAPGGRREWTRVADMKRGRSNMGGYERVLLARVGGAFGCEMGGRERAWMRMRVGCSAFRTAV